MRIEIYSKREEAMRNSIRCCISCILPCGALDVIRIVHSNGRVEEISGTMIKAADVMKDHPKHVLKKPSSPSSQEAAVLPKIVVVPPDALLQRGKIYFLMPLPPPQADSKNHHHHRHNKPSSGKKHKRKEHTGDKHVSNSNGGNNGSGAAAVIVSCDRYLTEILSEEKLSTQRERRRGRAAVWRPHLESISESPPTHL